MSELEDLKKLNEELRAKIMELEFTSKLNRFIADQRADTINKLLESQTNFLKKTLMSDEKEIIRKMLKRIQVDNEKYDELQKYLMKTFPKILKIKKNEDIKPQEQARDDLSQSYIDENGNMYTPKHIIDVAMILMSQLKKQIEDILGNEYSDDDEESDIF